MRKRRRRPNWPYRFALLVIAGLTLLYASVQAIIGAYTFESIFYQIDWTTAIISSLLDTTVAFWFVCVGASIGSFLNVVAYRLPIGRNVGGHSSCPYCRLQIDSGDNIPILGWLKIRGRCRSCRLPISIQYPLVELAVGLVFLAVYLSEFFFGGWNLPGEAGIPFSAGGLARISISVPLAVRLATYLFALGGLIGAALIAVRKQKVPFKLYFWCLVPLGISVLCAPDFIILRWRDALPAGGVEMRLDALVNMLCGSVAGIAMARLLAPLLYPGFDRSLMSGDVETSGARQLAGAMAVAGAIIGWQSIVPMTWVLLLAATFCVFLIRRFAQIAWLADLTVWVWLGLLIFRAFWKSIVNAASWLPDFVPDVVLYVGGAIAAAPLAMLFARVARGPHAEEKPKIEQDPDEDSAAEDYVDADGPESKLESDASARG